MAIINNEKLKFFKHKKLHFLYNKKGVFFTFIAILLITVLMIVFSPETEISFNKDIPVVKTRVTKINDFITDFEIVYLKEILRSTTYKALTSLTYYMDEEDKFLTDLQSDFNEVVLYGTINSVPIDQITGKTIMANDTFINWTNRIKVYAKDALNVDLNFTIKNTSIYQTTPWLIDINLVLDYSLSSETASWSRNNVVIITKLSTDALYDPWYYANTNGTYKKKVIKTDIKYYEWDISNFKKFIKNETYYHWQNSSASNFLMRFTNTFLPSSCCGIESAVNPNKITPSNVLESYMEHQFWNHTYLDQCDELYNVTGIWDEYDGFKLNFDNLIRYNLTGEDDSIPCCGTCCIPDCAGRQCGLDPNCGESCGSCTIYANMYCGDSSCICDSGWDSCDGQLVSGCETQLGTDTNCGSCGDECLDGYHCASESCVLDALNVTAIDTGSGMKLQSQVSLT